MSANFESDPEFNEAKAKPGWSLKSILIQLVVSLAILMVLCALMLPAVRSSREAARRIQCTNNLKQIALALHNYEQEYKALPPAFTVDAQGKPMHSWRSLILPFLDQRSIAQLIDFSKPWNDPANAKALETSLSVYQCPSSQGPQNMTTYLAIVGPNACFKPSEPRRLEEITDPHESTLMVIEVGRENAVPWMAPVDADESLVMNLGPASKLHHPGGTNSVTVSGGVHFLKSSIASGVRRALMTISGNEVTSADQW